MHSIVLCPNFSSFVLFSCRSKTCHLPAAAILNLQKTAEVALGLKIITVTKTKFAIRSVGHNHNPNFSSIGSEGILIDLGSLNSIRLSPGKDIVSLGPGAKWDEIYQELEKHELTTVGGRTSGVGAGGLISGGSSGLLLELTLNYAWLTFSAQGECPTFRIIGAWHATMSRISR